MREITSENAAIMTYPKIREGISQLKGSELVKSNVTIAKIIRTIVAKSLGPFGSKKFLVDSLKYYKVSGEGATILEKMSLWHPIANILIKLATTQKDVVGDGSISTVVVASELLERAARLLDEGIHPSVIIKGYHKALKKTLSILDEIAEEIDCTDREVLKNVAYTALSAKLGTKASSRLTDMALDVFDKIRDKRDTNWIANINLVHFIQKPGGSINDSISVRGMVMDERRIHPGMPTRIKNAKIAVLESPLELSKLDHHPPTVRGKIAIDDLGLIKPFIEAKPKLLREWVNKIKNSGANVVFCEKRIDEMIGGFLSRAGIMTITLYRWAAKDKFITRIARACGANLARIDELEEEDLGFADLAEEREFGNSKMVILEGCKNPRAASIIIRGISAEIMQDAERAVLDALHAKASLFRCNKIVAGGGAVEAELKKRLTMFSREFGGKDQLAIQAFADAMLCIPRELVRNTGLNPYDILPSLNMEHQQSKNIWSGYNTFTRKVSNMMNAGIIMPLEISKAIIKGACETAISILRIDDMLNLKKDKKEEIPPDASGRTMQLPGFLSAEHLPQYKDHKKKFTVF
ncbi:MAG: thermosome subunit beta [Promethearchaeota archaeon]